MSKLKQIREIQNLTQEELSEKSGVSVRTIQRIEAGTPPKGYTLKTLSKTLCIHENKLLQDETQIIIEKHNENFEEIISTDYSKIKLINLSSILFVVIPPLNILAPLLLIYVLKQKDAISRQIISVQILWTILAPIVFILGIFLKLGRTFTLILMIVIVLSNVFIILRNTAEIDHSKRLYYKLNFNIL